MEDGTLPLPPPWHLDISKMELELPRAITRLMTHRRHACRTNKRLFPVCFSQHAFAPVTLSGRMSVIRYSLCYHPVTICSTNLGSKSLFLGPQKRLMLGRRLCACCFVCCQRSVDGIAMGARDLQCIVLQQASQECTYIGR